MRSKLCFVLCVVQSGIMMGIILRLDSLCE